MQFEELAEPPFVMLLLRGCASLESARGFHTHTTFAIFPRDTTSRDAKMLGHRPVDIV